MSAPTLNAAALLAAWEAGLAQSATQRALSLLAAAWPEMSAPEWAEAAIGTRDRSLLILREELFGPKFEAVADCPKCRERIEVEFNAEEFCRPASLTETNEPNSAWKILQVSAAGYEIEFRLPTSSDLIEIAGPNAAEGARESLLQRCLQSAWRDGLPVETATLPDEAVRAVTEEMAKADPQAEIRIALVCPACQQRWSLLFDIASFLWSEIEDWARRLLRDVHQIASAYGWPEREILAIGARRRRSYLEMIGA
jgi:hypothetical protein